MYFLQAMDQVLGIIKVFEYLFEKRDTGFIFYLQLQFSFHPGKTQEKLQFQSESSLELAKYFLEKENYLDKAYSRELGNAYSKTK